LEDFGEENIFISEELKDSGVKAGAVSADAGEPEIETERASSQKEPCK
jgi:hypothetical protein